MTDKKGDIWSDLLYLTVCGICQCKANREMVLQMDWPKVYEVSCFHNLSSLCCTVVEDVVDTKGLSEEQQEIYRKWQEEKNKALRKQVLLDVERGKLEQFMEEHKIWYMPLKGVVLQKLYPKQGMRQMADNDILFDAGYRKEVRNWFESNGYRIEAYGRSNHDVYQKEPVLNYEMHISLFSPNVHNTLWTKYYDNVLSRLVVEDDKQYGRRFTTEDFYVYFILHAFKHFDVSGTGLRTLVDAAVYLNAYKDTIDWEYVEKQLDDLNLTGFEQSVRSAASKLYTKETAQILSENISWKTVLTEEETTFVQYLLHAGTYGTVQNQIQKKMKELQPDGEAITVKTKLRYCVNRIFPSPDFFWDNYAFIGKHRWLLPAGYLYRIVKGFVTGGKRLFREAKTAWKMGKE